MSDANCVREFNLAAEQNVPNGPSKPMTLKEVSFIGKMILDELLELYSTVMECEDAKNLVYTQIKEAKELPQLEYANDITQIAEQADAFVDIWYYSLNAAAKKGINLSNLFKVVHDANMSKRDINTGKFIKREDGKIIKPKGWKEPDVVGEMLRQHEFGAWN